MSTDFNADSVEQAIQQIADEDHVSLPNARFWYSLRQHLAHRGFYTQLEQDRVGQQKRIADYQAKWFPVKPEGLEGKP